jgi:hypothetical protein
MLAPEQSLGNRWESPAVAAGATRIGASAGVRIVQSAARPGGATSPPVSASGY